MRSTKKVLIAEDELLVGRVLKLVLEKNNYLVEHVIDAESAVSMANELKPDLIILDVCLKNKSSGIEAGKKIRRDGIICPIVFTTGNSHEQTMSEIKEIENSYLFIKPVEIEQLLNFLENNIRETDKE